ncbi:protein PRRC2C [Drosophila sechellia]|uniref:GM15562 n=1 Tax=Drosophila sechellia TaxID=7238 RepID=B4I8J4_DROSE|nr:protein PRRC2C [Drosophila sechellia]EDW56919.1 GM15562 [Drosophila sechellia]
MDYRAMNESCQCPRCRYELRLSNQPMPCHEQCFPEKYLMCGSDPRPRWQNRPDPREVFQNFSQRNPQILSQESAQSWSFQHPPNCFCGHQTPIRALPDHSQQFSQEYSQQCSQQSPCVSRCGHQNRQNCFQPPCPNWTRPCCCITHEVGVQTDEADECEISEPEIIEPEYIAITDITTKEMKVKHRTGKTETIIEKVQSVTRFPVTETQRLGEIDNETKFVRDKAEEEDAIPHRPMRHSELEPLLESMRAEVPRTESKDAKEELVYQEYEKTERDFDDPEAKVEKIIINVKIPDLPEAKASNSSQPNGIPPPSQLPSTPPPSRQPSGIPPPSQLPSTPPPSRQPSDIAPPSRLPNSITPPSQLPNKDTSQPSIPGDISSISVEDPSLVKNDVTSDSSSKDLVVYDQKELVETEMKEGHSESDIVSTVHVKVTNRKEASMRRHHDGEPNKTAFFESSVSQVLIKKAEKKLEEKKPKRPPPKVEVKLGYPPNDLVCRYANPPRCRPKRVSCRCPCPPSISCNQCPSCPRSTSQCDPIYGFGGMCVGYYCL